MPDSKALTILKNIKTAMEAEAVFNPVISGVETYSNAPVMDSRPTDNTPAIRILLAPGEWSFEEFSDWGTGELVGTLTCEAYVLVRCINPTQHDLAVYWGEQILAWVQYKYFEDTLSVTKAGGMEPITILDPQEDPDITRREMRVWFSMAASPTGTSSLPEARPDKSYLLPSLEEGGVSELWVDFKPDTSFPGGTAKAGDVE